MLRIFKYQDAVGVELVLVLDNTTRTEDDYLDSYYRLHSKADSEAFGVCDDNEEFGFTVRIDGRS